MRVVRAGDQSRDKVERGEQSHPVWQKNGVIRMFCTLPMCELDARVVEEEEERANA
jgi:hypothetical protein